MHFKTHNGTITVKNPKTGGHRVFTVWTKRQDADFAPGQRLIAVKEGGSFKSFGFVDESGIYLFRNKRFKLYAQYARIAWNNQCFPNLEYHYQGKCRVCNRKLSDPQSLTEGIGATCKKKNVTKAK